MPALEKRDANVITPKEFAAGRGKWPCVRCGRFETEDCNGMGTGDYCPNGRKRYDMLAEKWPTLKEACRITEKSKAQGIPVTSGILARG